jgi:hypothetical protein
MAKQRRKAGRRPYVSAKAAMKVGAIPWKI